jgi:TonB family protein
MHKARTAPTIYRSSLTLAVSMLVGAGFSTLLWEPPAQANHMFLANTAKRADTARPAIRDKWAVLIAVNEHRDHTLPDNPDALKSTEQLASALNDPAAGQFAPGHILTITGDIATVSGISRAINEWLAKKALPDDMVVVYVSGLTAVARDGRSLLCTYETRADNLTETSVDLHEVLGELRQRTQSKSILVLFDTSPFAVSGKETGANLKQLSNDGLTVMTAAEGTQQSLNNGVLGQSLFTHHLVEAIRIRNGALTLDEVFNHVSSAVTGDAQRAFARLQTPTLSLPASNTNVTMIAIGTPVKSAIKKPAPFGLGHPVERLALERPELMPPRPGGRAMVITPRHARNLMAQLPPDSRNLVVEPELGTGGPSRSLQLASGPAIAPPDRTQLLVAKDGVPEGKFGSTTANQKQLLVQPSPRATFTTAEERVDLLAQDTADKPVCAPVSEQKSAKPASKETPKSADSKGSSAATDAALKRAPEAAVRPAVGASQSKPLALPAAGSAAKPSAVVAPKKALKPADDDDDEDDKPRVVVDYKEYMSKMKRDIQSHWTPPGGLDNLKIVAQITITRDGRILNPQILQGSGKPEVDKSALAALQAASPLDPLPAGAPRSIDVKYIFDWHVSGK